MQSGSRPFGFSKNLEYHDVCSKGVLRGSLMGRVTEAPENSSAQRKKRGEALFKERKDTTRKPVSKSGHCGKVQVLIKGPSSYRGKKGERKGKGGLWRGGGFKGNPSEKGLKEGSSGGGSPPFAFRRLRPAGENSGEGLMLVLWKKKATKLEGIVFLKRWVKSSKRIRNYHEGTAGRHQQKVCPGIR